MRLVLAAMFLSSVAHADGRNLFYGELLGKAGEYGVGYERQLLPRLAIGGAASFAVVRGEQIATAAPYIHVPFVHGLFGELGAIVAHSRVPSPVADWMGTSATGGGGFASAGYEHTTKHLVLRVAGSLIVGRGGAAPALGFSIGVRP